MRSIVCCQEKLRGFAPALRVGASDVAVDEKEDILRGYTGKNRVERSRSEGRSEGSSEGSSEGKG